MEREDEFSIIYLLIKNLQDKPLMIMGGRVGIDNMENS